MLWVVFCLLLVVVRVTAEVGGPLHENITVTVFWVGEGASDENGYIHNKGVDDPDNRNGYYPAGFIPKENPFYFALPYSDFTEEGKKPSASQEVPWAKDAPFNSYGKYQSFCKNLWIRITKDRENLTSLHCYAQWEDSGPFGVDDIHYVFGTSRPQNPINNNAGLDVSPAVRDYLQLNGIDVVHWQFVQFEEVPEGPWKNIITASNDLSSATTLQVSSIAISAMLTLAITFSS